jgi:hypothetical protein
MPCTLPLGEVSGVFMSGVRVDPDEADFALLAAKVAGDASHGADGHGVVAAQDQRDLFLGEGAVDHHRQTLAGERDLGQVFGAVGTFGQTFRLVDGHIAEIVGVVAEGGEALIQIGDADGGGTHVDTAAALAEVEGRADDGDVGRVHAMDEFSAAPCCPACFA